MLPSELTVGDGDFSFSLALARASSSDCTLVATAFDSEEEVTRKYGDAATNIAALRAGRNSTVLFGVDGTRLGQSLQLQDSQRFDRITFNFPHSGISGPSALASNRQLLSKFFGECLPLLAAQGLVEVALKTTARYNTWGIHKLAVDVGLNLQRVRKFKLNYTHRKTKHDEYTDKVRNDQAVVWTFGVEETEFKIPHWLQQQLDSEQNICELCDMVFTSESDLRTHSVGQQHKRKLKFAKKRQRQDKQADKKEQKKLKRQRDGAGDNAGPHAQSRADGTLFCELCRTFCNSAASWQMHISGAKHLARVQEAPP